MVATLMERKKLDLSVSVDSLTGYGFLIPESLNSVLEHSFNISSHEIFKGAYDSNLEWGMCSLSSLDRLKSLFDA